MYLILLIILTFIVLGILIISHKIKQIKREIINNLSNQYNYLITVNNSNKDEIFCKLEETNQIILPVIKEKEENKTHIEKLFSFSSPSLGETLKNDPSIFQKEDYLEIQKIKFLHYSPYGLSEIFGRRDYEFGGLKDCIFIDVGANVGDSSLYSASLSNVLHVYSYEPFIEAYNSAKQNIELNNNLSKKITLMNSGWYDKNAQQKISTITHNSAINSIDETFKDKITRKILNTKELDKITIELKESKTELLSIIKKHPKAPIILKIDIEGAEYECLDNISDLLQHVDVILVEWHFRGYETIVELLEKNNFIWFNELFMPEIGLIRAYNKNIKRLN